MTRTQELTAYIALLLSDFTTLLNDEQKKLRSLKIQIVFAEEEVVEATLAPEWEHGVN